MGAFYSLDPDNGKIFWKFDLPVPEEFGFHGRPFIKDTVIYFSTDGHWRNRTGKVYALGLNNGDLLWKTPIDKGAPSDAIVADSFIYIVSLDDVLWCLDTRTGAPLWHFRSNWIFTDKDGRNLISSPVLAGNIVLFAGRDSTVYALDRFSGELLWDRRPEGAITTTLLVFDSTLIYGADSDNFFRMNIRDGRLIGSEEFSFYPYGEPLRRDSTLYFLTYNNHDKCRTLASYHLRDNKLLWISELPDSIASEFMSLSVLHFWKDLLLVSASDGRLLACDPESGAWRWSFRFEGIIASLGSHQDLVYVGTRSGRLYAFRP